MYIRNIVTLLVLVVLAGSCSSPRPVPSQVYTAPRDLDALLAESAGVQTTWDADSSMVATTGQVIVDVPLRLKSGVRVSAGQESFGLSIKGANAQARLVAPGVALFSGTARNTNTAIQVLGDRGVRLISVLKGPSAPSSLTYIVTLPKGARIDSGSDGLRLITAAGKRLATVPNPWAVDAAGKRLNAFYTVSGHDVTLHVDHDHATYPVIADPWFVPLLVGVALAIGKQLVDDFVLQPATCRLSGGATDCPDTALAPDHEPDSGVTRGPPQGQPTGPPRSQPLPQPPSAQPPARQLPSEPARAPGRSPNRPVQPPSQPVQPPGNPVTPQRVDHFACTNDNSNLGHYIPRGRYWQQGFTSRGSTVTGGWVALGAHAGGDHRALVGIYAGSGLSAPLATTEVHVTGYDGEHFQFQSPARVRPGQQLYLAVQGIGDFTAYNNRAGCFISNVIGMS